MTDQESLIREAIAAEADRAVDHRTVLAQLHARRSRRRPLALIAAATLTAVAAAVAVAVPLTVDRAAPPMPPAATPTARTVLLIGLDGQANTDSIVLARMGADGALSAVSLPRDSLIDLPGVGVAKLNSAYPRAHAAARAEGRDGDAAGAEALVRVVEGLAGVEVDHYAAVDMAKFAVLADAVGGVEICLRTAARDESSGIDLGPGRHTLSGEQALAFLRQRHGLPNGDLDRITRQQAFLHSLVAEVADRPDESARLVEVARTLVRTDPGWDPLEFARLLSPTVRTATIPVGEPVTTAEAGMGLRLDPSAVRAFTAAFLADAPAGTPSSQDAPASPGIPEAPGRSVPEDGCVA